MRRIRCFALITTLLCLLVTGCTGNTAKNIYKDKDKPKPAEKENQ